MLNPIVVTVTGAAGNIGYSLVFRIAAGELLGKEQPVELRLLDIPVAAQKLEGLKKELEDCAFNTLSNIVITTDVNEAFVNSDVVFLVGSRPRTKGMERNDLLAANAAIFKVQGKAINDYAKKTVKVLVVGNPANTNCYIAMKNAPDLNESCFSAMLRLDHNRAVNQIAFKTGTHPSEVKKMIIWGNHSVTQVPDINFCEIGGKKAIDLVDSVWVNNEFTPIVQNRGAEIISLRGSSSAGSAANAAINQMRNWLLGTPENDWVTMGVVSDGSYGIPEGYVFGFPVTCSNGEYSIVKGLNITDSIKKDMLESFEEIKEEADAVQELLV